MYKGLIVLEVDSQEDADYDITTVLATAEDIIERFKDMRIAQVAVIRDSLTFKQ